MSEFENKKILVTSALPYVNNVPHLGNLIGCVLSADVFARFARSKFGKDNVLYVCGSDEHGTTTETKAREEGITPKQLCDKYYKLHKDIYAYFDISFDIFGRTSDPTQVKNTQAIFHRLYENGFVVEDTLKQTFCEHDNMFLADRFVEGTCPHCGYEDARGDQCDNCSKMLNPEELVEPTCKMCNNRPIIKEVNHLFLDLEKLQPQLQEWVKDQSIIGNWSQNALRITNGWFKEGLTKRCITRDLSWGVPVPLKGWENKVFYVWFDAPIGYVSITEQLVGDDYKNWWNNPDDVRLIQFMGKDNIPFHSILFPASLIGTKDKWTKVHNLSSTEYLQYEGGKFSKSRNVGVFGDDVQKTNIPVDVFRYYLLSNRPETSDTNFTWQELADKNNNELVATLGNLVNRTLVFIDRYAEKEITDKPDLQLVDKEFFTLLKEKYQHITELLEKASLRDALKGVMEVARLGNGYFQNAAPWVAIKEDKERALTSLYVLAHVCRDLAILIEPYLPQTAQSIFDQLGIKKQFWSALGELSLGGQKITQPKHLFGKVEEKTVTELQEQFSGKEDEPKIPSQKEIFSSFDLRVGKVIDVKQHPDADKLFIEQVDLGPLGTRQIVSGLSGHYEPEELLGKSIVVVANLKSAKLRGEKSEGMLLAAEDKKNVGVVVVDAPAGSQVSIPDITQEPKKQISIDDFFSVTLTSTPDGVFLEKDQLFADKKPLIPEKDIVGKVR